LGAPEDGWDQRPKHVELIGIFNKPLLLHPVGVYIIHINDARSNKYQGSLPRSQQPISCSARKPDSSRAQTPPHFAWVRQEILKRTDWILEINSLCH